MIFDTIKSLAMGAYDIWNWIFIELIPKYIPEFLLVSLDHRWYHNALVGAAWLAIYVLLNYLYFKVIGAPVWAAYRHMRRHGCKMLPFWHILIYLFLVIYTSQNSAISGRGIDITPFAAILIAWAYFLVKAGWRVIYFPLLQAMLLVFLFGAFCLFIPALIVWLGMMFLGHGLMQFGAKPTCDKCGRVSDQPGVCRFCGGTIR
jgi:hypothetical protein